MASNYLNNDTISALSSAAGKSAIAVLRISGKNAFSIVEKIFVSYSKNFKQTQVGLIVDDNQKIDEVVCMYFKAPHSYTGEDTVEISAHGNPLIVKKILSLLNKNGARNALPGEFTYRAFLNGKKDLAQAEAVCSIITSKTETAIKAALNNIKGDFSQKINFIKADLIRFMSYLEASLDYPQDDIPFLTQEQKLEMIENLTKETQKLIDNYKISKILQSGLKAVIIGKPNAGKSSLLNAILGKNRAIVTDIAGTTTDTIEETIDCRGIPLVLIDTAGIRDDIGNYIEVLGQKKTKEALGAADILIWVFDSSVSLDKNDFQIAKEIKDMNFSGSIFLVLNKKDLPQKVKKAEIKKLVSHTDLLSVSTNDFESVKTLLDAIATAAGVLENQNDYLMINARHWDLLNKAQTALLLASEIIHTKNEDEIACYETRIALSSFEEILGINTPTDILDSIFSTFCIGK
jgi:tRNA modification GTPase